MRPELVVTHDLAATAAAEILRIRPRTLALAGGATPRLLYERLAGTALPWATTEIFFSDERCVPPDHPASNYRMVYEALLAKVAARPHRMPAERCDPRAYERELREVFGPGTPAFDLVLLGIGSDGHTASLFPGDPALDERERLVVRVPRPDHPRLTMTLPVLSAAHLALFLVAGPTKRRALRRLLAGDDIPAARVHADRVIIIADREAAP